MPTDTPPLPITPDYDAWPIEVMPERVEHTAGQVTLVWADGRRSRYHGIWLRENAADDSTVNPATRERILDLSRLAAWPSVAAAWLDDAGALNVTFAPEDRTLRFHPGWLRAHDYSNARQFDAPLVPVIRWTGETHAVPQSLDAGDWLARDPDDRDARALLDAALTAVLGHGLVRLRNLPTEPGTLARIAERIGPVRPTNFGSLFDVRAKPEPDSNAYTSIALPPHVDLPTREYQPGLQLLHCLENSVEGGQAVMMDGFAVADALRDRDPRAFETLTTVTWCYANTARTTDHVWHAPMIQLDAAGRLVEVRIADFLRGPLMAPFEAVEPAYEALMTLQRMLREPHFAMRFTYRPGDLVIFDNRRLLHARDAFEGRSGHRWLQGCYLERDEVRSRLRMLRRAERQRRVAARDA
ncbi:MULTISPECIES: TauD/TfdA family dioxygenase [Modicisalibacter]|uniref:TauD/TfdA family dioxygenase n=1 Tax=Modicisalibacter TaxID=574347 RepID=UPI00100B9DB1|nr:MULTISPECIES: TauD/TfdA family dioxygenase [Halomonadaceae]MBZ9557277.1 TauD/TfdA family dioxygenase [Modicisalibacter sp. R2A 31.J]MBZ9574009.1 TauD/TfdA family dioxygenase [Modicisalibacter sp. MOD 31.J]